MSDDQIGLVVSGPFALLVRKLKSFIIRRSIASTVEGFERTPQGLVPIPGAFAEFTEDYPFQMRRGKEGNVLVVRFLPGTITAALQAENYDGTPEVNGEPITNSDHYLPVGAAGTKRTFYETTWEPSSQQIDGVWTIVDATLEFSELKLATTIPPDEAPEISLGDGTTTKKGKFHLPIGVLTVTENGISDLFNDSVRSSHRIVYCPQADWRPYPIT